MVEIDGWQISSSITRKVAPPLSVIVLVAALVFQPSHHLLPEKLMNAANHDIRHTLGHEPLREISRYAISWAVLRGLESGCCS